MEQISRKDGIIYYGGQPCDDIDDAYMLFRRDYHDSIGRRAFSRMDRLGQRSERIHGFGFVFRGGHGLGSVVHGHRRRRCFLLGLVNLSYCWIVGLSDMARLDERELDGYIDMIFEKGSGMLKFIGKRDGHGRTSKLLKKRYR